MSYSRLLRKVNRILDKIPDEKFKKDIEGDVDLFVKTFHDKPTPLVDEYFLIYLENMGNKYHSTTITYHYITKNYKIRRSGWMRKQQTMMHLGITDHYHRPIELYLPSARKILLEMYESHFLSREQFDVIASVINSMPGKFPEAVKSADKERIIVFLAIFTTLSVETIEEISELFWEFERQNGIKKHRSYYYSNFKQAIDREGKKRKLSVDTSSKNIDGELPTGKRVNLVLEKISDERLKTIIQSDIRNFIIRISGLNLERLELYFLVFIEFMARKHGSQISKEKLLSSFSLSSEGWEDRQHILNDLGLLVERSDFRFDMAKRILFHMREFEIISDRRYERAIFTTDNIPDNLKSSIPNYDNEIVLAFYSIHLTGDEANVEISDMFTRMDEKLGIISVDAFYTTLFNKLIKSKEKLTQDVKTKKREAKGKIKARKKKEVIKKIKNKKKESRHHSDRRIKIRSITEPILKKIPDKEFKKNIKKDILRFEDVFITQNLLYTERCFLIFIDYLARKKSPMISAYITVKIIKERRGWMKSQKKLMELGFITKGRVDYLTPAKHILEKMEETDILTSRQFEKAKDALLEIPSKFPRLLKSQNLHILLSFMSIYFTSNLSLNEITTLFLKLDEIMELELDRWYYSYFYRVLKKLELPIRIGSIHNT
ncbi:MAG: hypothetical protein GPJ54_17430 [Candidatus Heimdallarchaeota archaeon]|nr:hypothetical protein [Candidatus Heimdallarchaeota archaeon]